MEDFQKMSCDELEEFLKIQSGRKLIPVLTDPLIFFDCVKFRGKKYCKEMLEETDTFKGALETFINKCSR